MSVCDECDGRGQILDAPANVLDGHPYWITCPKCGGQKKPTVKLLGEDSNAFTIMALCRRAMRDADWPKAKIDAVLDEMQHGDYDHLLQTAMKYLEVE